MLLWDAHTDTGNCSTDIGDAGGKGDPSGGIGEDGDIGPRNGASKHCKG
jgi:hypothetical protein